MRLKFWHWEGRNSTGFGGPIFRFLGFIQTNVFDFPLKFNKGPDCSTLIDPQVLNWSVSEDASAA